MNKYKIETYVSTHLMPVEYAETWHYKIYFDFKLPDIEVK